MSEVQDAIDNAVKYVSGQTNEPEWLVTKPVMDAARRVANAVPIYMTSRLSREYAVTDDPTQADAWLIDLPEGT